MTSSSPPRSRRRLSRQTTRAEEREQASLSTILSNRRVQLSQLLSAPLLDSGAVERDDEGSDDSHIDVEPPAIRGSAIMFDDVDEAIESEDDEHDHYYRPWDNLGYEQWYALRFHGIPPEHYSTPSSTGERTRERLRSPPPPLQPPPPSILPATAHSSVTVRQPWNRERAWSPYVYQQPLPNNAVGGVRATIEGIKQNTLPGMGREQARLYSVHSSICELTLDCLSTSDGEDGTASFRSMLRANSAVYTTSSPTNVHVELCFVPRRHCVVERILVQSAKTFPRCTELMVFASSRRCKLEELNAYDGFTFAHYERLAGIIKQYPDRLPEPLPIAYFWFSFEENYKQLQVLPHGVACKYLYVKLLRGDGATLGQALRTMRVYGWSGARSFSEAVIC
ncbi:hypothetical protein GGI02_002952 [Coemansia sp. RSA 2322]|nr:hypothetical protein GGI02_002952 [Coemansia sp. RSA 2322]